MFAALHRKSATVGLCCAISARAPASSTRTRTAPGCGSGPSYARKGAAWYVSPEGNDLVFQRLAAVSGGASMVERGGCVMISSYAGYPIIVADKMPTSTGDLSDGVMALFGNMSQAVAFGVRRDIRIRVDESRYAEFDQLALIATQRYEIAAHDVGTASAAGPLVALVGE